MPTPTPSLLPYDPEGAKKLLDDAGWKVGADGIRAKDGVKLKLRYATTDQEVRKNTQVIVQQMLKDVGVDVELINHSSDVFFAGYAEKGPIATGPVRHRGTLDRPVPSPIPTLPSWLCKEIPSDENPSGTNNQFFCDKDLDALFAKEATTVDPAGAHSNLLPDRANRQRQSLLEQHVE